MNRVRCISREPQIKRWCGSQVDGAALTAGATAAGDAPLLAAVDRIPTPGGHSTRLARRRPMTGSGSRVPTSTQRRR